MESEVHPVLTLYESPFDPTQPELGMIAYNLGVSEAEHRAVLGDDKSLEFVVADPEWPVDWFQLPDGDLVSLFPGRPADWPSYCGSQISFKGLAGQSYSLIIVTSLPDGNWRLCTPMKIYVTGTVEKQEPEPSGKTEEPEGTETSGESGDSPDETETPNGLETLEGQPSLFHGALAELGME
ncbi:MAG: hypothetical protein LBT98_02490, partial [Puniceicoccales bacterium]|nr:hypothetical protein [Puniceicoccales bacterium]